MKKKSTNSPAMISLIYAAVYFGLCGIVHAQNLPERAFGNQNEAPASIIESGSQSAISSPDGIWTQTAPDLATNSNATVNISAVDAREIVVDPDQLRTVLSQAPLDQPGMVESQRPAPSHIHLPSPNGGYVQFSIRRSQLLSPEMEAQYPGVTTYRGYAVNDPATTAVLDLTSSGFHAQVLQPGRRWFIDPQFKDNTLRYLSYHKASKGENRQCMLDSSANQSALPQSPTNQQSRSGDMLRNYRLAVATTGEYGQFFGGAAAAANAIATTINRVAGIYEKELAITFTLSTSIYDDPATDPFTGNGNAFVLINESQTQLDIDIGSANYDVGHTFSTGAGGLAGLGVICSSSSKGRGVTGLSNPTGDVFDVDFVAHEIGHQFSGNHTFNGAIGNCSGGNRNGGTAYEPGSGSTIQAYAGICGADNLQSNSDAQMHTISHLEMINHVENGSGSLCGTVTSLSNTVPTVDAFADYAIPHSTPFILVGDGADADADPVTFSWEQLDLGPQATLVAADDGQIPLFRVLPLSTSAIRYFPSLTSVEANTSNSSEKLPILSRTAIFALTVRDNAGGVDFDLVSVTVDGDSGPFAVTAPNGGETISGNHLVTWDVAGTDGAPISASNVTIMLSTGGAGSAYSVVLADTPNDGSEMVDFSAFDTTTARLLIADNDGSSHTFYDISNATFAIEAPVAVTTCNGLAITVDLNLGQSPTSGNDVILGTPGDDEIRGLGGDDTICGMDGLDTIFGGPGADTLYGGDSLGNDTQRNDLFGGNNDDRLFGGPYDDYLFGQGGMDSLETNNSLSGLADQLFGGSGNDILVSFSPSGSLMRGQGNSDEMRGSPAADDMQGGPGLDTMFGNGGNDDMNGGLGADTMFGGDDDDTMVGAGSRDDMFGEDGNDTLSGGVGNDDLDGGADTDVCNGQGEEAVGAGDTAVNCETETGIPRPAQRLKLNFRPGMLILSDKQLEMIDKCDLTLDECLGRQPAIR